MTETVIAALIAGAVTLIVCVINNLFQQRKAEERQQQTISMLEYKLDNLTRQVEKHNNLVERMYSIEEKATLYEEKMKVANHRIDDLEKHAGCLRKEEKRHEESLR